MTNLVKLLGVALLGSLGFTFIVLGCVLSQTWWTLLIFLFYGFTPLPLLFVNNNEYDSLDGEPNKTLDIAIFFVTGIVVSTLAFPILLSHTPVEKPTINFTNAFLTEFATLIFYTTAGLFFTTTSQDEGDQF